MEAIQAPLQPIQLLMGMTILQAHIIIHLAETYERIHIKNSLLKINLKKLGLYMKNLSINLLSSIKETN